MPPIHVKVPTEGEEGEIDGPLEGVEDRMVGTGAHHAHSVHSLVELALPRPHYIAIELAPSIHLHPECRFSSGNAGGPEPPKHGQARGFVGSDNPRNQALPPGKDQGVNVHGSFQLLQGDAVLPQKGVVQEGSNLEPRLPAAQGRKLQHEPGLCKGVVRTG